MDRSLLYAIIVIILVLYTQNSCGTNEQQLLEQRQHITLPDLPPSHLKRYLNTFPRIRQECMADEECQRQLNTENQDYDDATDNALCWGHESHCDKDKRFHTPTCPGKHAGWVRNKEAQIDTFYQQADFGYIKHQLNELRLMCEAEFITDSSLECSKYLRFCRGRNLMLDFRDLATRTERIRYQMDVLSSGHIKGYCKLNKTRLQQEQDHMGALQSWAPELRYFEESAVTLYNNPDECDMFINTPTYLMKIDATYNMYHHFCDFFNLYATLFVNQTHPTSFDRNNQIIVWETYPYDSPFAVTFKAFSQNPIWTLNQVKGKRICFRNVVLPLLPRMIFGLYYNTPIIQGCENSGLFRAFSEFILHRLKVPFEEPQEKLRITFFSRRTKYRRVLNEEQLLKELRKNKSYEVKQISYERDLTFLQQLQVTRNSDILIGMHGAGLTHLLFLPNWATIFELYNCEDPNCYKDLARLRGINYITWEHRDLVSPEDEGHHPEGGAHAKFTNYEFDVSEFVRLVNKGAKHVREHSEFKKFSIVASSSSSGKEEL